MEPNRNGEHRRRRRLGWLWLLLALLLVAAGLGVGLGMRGGDDDGGSSNAGGGATTGVAGASKTLQGAGRLTSGSSNLLAWLRNSGRLAAVAGKPVTATGVKVVSVVGDEVFWIGRSNADRILVHLETNGESGPTVRRRSRQLPRNARSQRCGRRRDVRREGHRRRVAAEAPEGARRDAGVDAEAELVE